MTVAPQRSRTPWLANGDDGHARTTETSANSQVGRGHDNIGRSWSQLHNVDLRIIPASSGEQLPACHDGAAQGQMHLARAALEGFGLPVPAPRLQAVSGGAQ